MKVGAQNVGNGVFSAIIPARIAPETVMITAKYNSVIVGNHAMVIFISEPLPIPPSLTASTITAAPTRVNADGVSTAAVLVQFKEGDGTNLEVDGANVQILMDEVAVSFTDKGNGLFEATVPARTAATTVNITAKYEGSLLTYTATVEFIPAVNLAATVVAATPASISADGVTATAKVSFKNYASNSIPIDLSKVNLLADGVVLVGLQNKGNGVFEAIIPARNTGAIVEISATFNGTDIVSKTAVEFVPVVVAPVLSRQLSTVVANPITIIADGIHTSVVTISLKDAFDGAFNTNESVTITSSLGQIRPVSKAENGIYTATLVSTATGEATITVQVGTAVLESKPVVTFIPDKASIVKSTLVAAAPAIAADGVSTTVITVTLIDAQGNRIITGENTITLATTNGTLGALTKNADGTYSAVLTASTTSGTAIISGTVNGTTFSNTTQVVFTALPMVNRPPVAANDNYTVNNNEKLTGNLLLNDTDVDGDQMSVKLGLVRQPLYGTVFMQADGKFTYTPNKGYAGEDSFTYEVCDNGNPAGCAQATATIQVKQGLVFIPEGFSPDGDGENDVFVVYGAEKYQVSLKVLNRWGDIVYQSKMYKNDWNGTANTGLVFGDKLPDGTYFYVVDLNNGEKPRTHSLIIKRK